ncbi:MAG: SURF1 family cytochrome oxidase biogenesis protein [Allosphingosinicella sp.]
MVRLGIWQLHRAHEKDVLLARYEQNSKLPPMALPLVGVADDKLLYRTATAFCLSVRAGARLAARARPARAAPATSPNAGPARRGRASSPTWASPRPRASRRAGKAAK